MHTPNAQPSADPQTAGKARRYVLGTTAIRPVRLDANSDAALLWLKAQLSGPTAKDAASCSLVARRAIRLYQQHVASLLADRPAFAAERRAVRELSRLPVSQRASVRRKERLSHVVS